MPCQEAFPTVFAHQCDNTCLRIAPPLVREKPTLQYRHRQLTARRPQPVILMWYFSKTLDT